MSAWLDPLARLYGRAWDLRRDAYARGWLAPERVSGARVVSVGNLTVGGTGKTTLTLRLARAALAAGRDVAVVCRRYRPGPEREGDEERLYRARLGSARVFAGRTKLQLARQAAGRGHDLVLVDDGFSHWRLARDLDLVLLDAGDPWGGGRLLPAGRLREPRRALARAAVVVVSRLGRGEDPAPLYRQARPYAPDAHLAAGRHAVTAVRDLEGEASSPGRVLVGTGTGNPAAVAASAREAGLEVAGLVAFPDHHAFREGEARALVERARREQATLLLTAKDAVRWPRRAPREAAVLEVEWEWVDGGDEAERRVLGEGQPT
jgi:tetraacyldisaccharide 4'-kinase